MNKIKLLLLSISILFSVSACTDAEWSSWAALGDEAHIQCYSGGEIVFDGWSTGKVSSSSHSDGYLFRNRATGVLQEVSGDCVVSYGK